MSQLITITESWIQTNENDDFLINECLPENDIPLSFPREFSTGGGILLIHRKDISISVIENLCNKDFETVTCRVLSLNYPILFISCYRPSFGNFQLFLEEFHGLLVKFSSEYILCCGYFNIHVNRISPASTDFKDILDEFDWYSQLNYLLIKVITLLILSLDHKSLKYVLLGSPHRITIG